MLEFRNKVVFVGYGSVARCTLPILLKHVNVPAKNITVIDFEDKAESLKPWIEQGVRYVRHRVKQGNMTLLLGQHLSSGDLLIDLAWNIECTDILQWYHRRNILYINTSVELWDPYTGALTKHPTERTLYWRHMKIRKLMDGWKLTGPTAVIEHGANPGLISHFTKQGLVDIGERLIADKMAVGKDAEEIRQFILERA
ncbi:MAG: saccharopine dehydrogenase NADP-binding domain-containing protein, partial [Planctomycetota bacterium]|nr:saccharopine dehydrogenase NADP-binding domain-containing protein [Planctomycetota bacterium]